MGRRKRKCQVLGNGTQRAKKRGVEDIFIACTDNLTGFSAAIGAVFPKTEIQNCIIHQLRNSSKYVCSRANGTPIPKKENHQIDLLVDNTETLLAMLERGELDFAIIEGVFDKEKYPHRLYKKESFLGICSRRHSFAGRTVSLEEVLQESLLVREKGSGTHMLQKQAVAARGYSLDSFSRHSSISNFSIICDLVAMDHLITFAYEPISHCRNDLATFRVEDMEITGEFNLVYINRSVAEPKADLFLATC